MSLNTLLLSDEMLKERSIVHGNMDAKLVYPDVKIAQDMYILPIIGTGLYDKIQAAINANSWIGITDYKLLLDNYIVDALVNYTLMQLPMSISYQFWNKGMARKTGQDTELPTMSELMDISNRYKDRGEFYGNRLKLYLRQNATAKYPEYFQPGTGVDTIYPDQNTFTMPIFLGDDDCSCKDERNKTQNQPYHE
jgi:hypothetical protein